MTSQVGRTYAVVGALMVLFLGWAAVAAHPWDAAPVDARVAALNEHRVQVRQDAAKAKRVVAVRWQRYEERLSDRRRAVSRAWQRRNRAETAFQQRLAVARANRPVVVRTVYAQAGSSGSPGASPGYTPPSGSGGYTPPASGGGSAPAPVAPAPVAAPPVVSVGGSAPVTSSGSS